MKTLNEMVIELTNELLGNKPLGQPYNDFFQDIIVSYLTEHARNIVTVVAPYAALQEISKPIINKTNEIEFRNGATATVYGTSPAKSAMEAAIKHEIDIATANMTAQLEKDIAGMPKEEDNIHPASSSLTMDDLVKCKEHLNKTMDIIAEQKDADSLNRVFKEAYGKVILELFEYPKTNIDTSEYNKRVYGEFVQPVKPTKCECGSEHVGSPRHSTWCPKYKENT